MTVTLQGCAAAPATTYDTALLDLDGVVYLGKTAVSGAPDLLSGARAAGMRLAFVTNNASRTPEEVAAHLTDLGVPATPDEVVTSSMAAAHLLAAQLAPGSPVLVVGGTGLRTAVADAGLTVVLCADHDPQAVVCGYGPTVNAGDLAEAAIAVGRGLPWIATNGDMTLPTARGLVPGNGALVATVTAATGRDPVIVGKPERPLHDEAVRRSGAARPLVVGDRLDTDIAGARRVGADSLLVLTGVATIDDVCSASPEERPAYLAADLRGLLVPHPHVEVQDGGVVCRRQAGDVDDGLDEVRVRVVRAWAGLT